MPKFPGDCFVGVNIKVDNVENYLNMKNQPKQSVLEKVAKISFFDIIIGDKK